MILTEGKLKLIENNLISINGNIAAHKSIQFEGNDGDEYDLMIKKSEVKCESMLNRFRKKEKTKIKYKASLSKRYSGKVVPIDNVDEVIKLHSKMESELTMSAYSERQKEIKIMRENVISSAFWSEK